MSPSQKDDDGQEWELYFCEPRIPWCTDVVFAHWHVGPRKKGLRGPPVALFYEEKDGQHSSYRGRRGSMSDVIGLVALAVVFILFCYAIYS